MSICDWRSSSERSLPRGPFVFFEAGERFDCRVLRLTKTGIIEFSPKLKSSPERVILVLNFDLQIETEGSSALVRIRGDLDLQVIDQVTDALARIESDAPELLVIDLSRLSFMDSSGMGVIAAASMRAADAGRRFAIVIPPAGVRQAFERTKLNEVITTTDDLANVYP